RNINERVVKTIDTEAKKQGLSRNEYLKNTLDTLTTYQGIIHKEIDIDKTLNKMTQAIEIVYKHMNKLEANNSKMYYLLCEMAGVDYNELDNMFKEVSVNE